MNLIIPMAVPVGAALLVFIVFWLLGVRSGRWTLVLGLLGVGITAGVVFATNVLGFDAFRALAVFGGLCAVAAVILALLAKLVMIYPEYRRQPKMPEGEAE